MSARRRVADAGVTGESAQRQLIDAVRLEAGCGGLEERPAEVSVMIGLSWHETSLPSC